jgi:hypothetical protein
MLKTSALLALFVYVTLISAQQVPNRISSGNPCLCDAASPETLKLRQCSLCAEAEKQTSGEVFFLKDINPRKPNRWLALPRKHHEGMHDLHAFTAEERKALWNAAIAKGIELFGEGNWGLAYNGADVRTQCHAHLHIGKFLSVAERNENFIVVSRVEDIPAPPKQGVWVHPVGGKLHVHTGEQITETILLR